MPHRGRLKIFLGYAAGVGKTYSMVESARVRKAQGVDVVVGLAVTHGRTDTERLLEGLEVFAPVAIAYKGVHVEEFDIDRVLKRHPELVLVDELAHTNVVGSRHSKRYMDIEELLDAGIDVYTTLNIQHVESFQDTIERATGISVRERVPDRIIDEADDIELIDLAPQDLLERLRQGKVYVPDQAYRAIARFFKQETLEFLREIALRKTASIVDNSRQKSTQREKPSSQTIAPKLLASIGPSPFSEKVIRVTKRLADILHAQWYVASVQTPDMAFLSESVTVSLARHMQLAEELGAKVVRLPGESVADTIFNFAQANGITQIILGHSLMPWYRRLYKRSPVDELVRKGRDIDIYIISSSQMPHATHELTTKEPTLFALHRYVMPVVEAAIVATAVHVLSRGWERPAIAALCICNTLASALWYPCVNFQVYHFASLFFLSSLFFARSIALYSQGALFAFGLLTIGTIVNWLMEQRRRLSSIAVARHRELLQLLDVSKDLAAAQTIQDLMQCINHHVSLCIQGSALVYLYEKGEYKLMGAESFDATEEMAARWAIDHQEPAGVQTNTLPSAKGLWLPMTVAHKKIGALGIFPPEEFSLLGNLPVLEAFAHMMALAFDRSIP